MTNTTMRKLILMCAIAVLAGAGSVLAQKPIIIIGPPIQFDQTLSVEDDVNGNFLTFDTGSGKYKFTRCSDGFTLGGTGFVKTDGCSITLADVRSDHRVVASIDECDQHAKAIVEVFLPAAKTEAFPPALQPDVAPFKAFLTDQNIANNLMDCAPKK